MLLHVLLSRLWANVIRYQPFGVLSMEGFRYTFQWISKEQIWAHLTIWRGQKNAARRWAWNKSCLSQSLVENIMGYKPTNGIPWPNNQLLSLCIIKKWQTMATLQPFYGCKYWLCPSAVHWYVIVVYPPHHRHTTSVWYAGKPSWSAKENRSVTTRILSIYTRAVRW